MQPGETLSIYYGSETGNGEGLARRLQETARGAGIATTLASLDGVRPAALARVTAAVFIVSTHGEGDPPEEAVELFEMLAGPRAPRPGLVTSIGGFSLHAGTVCESWQRSRLERLCRYITRPPIATKRLLVDAQGRVVYRYKRPFRDGSTHVVLEPLDLIARLAALVPRPKLNLTRFHGVFAPNFRHRHRVVPHHPKGRLDSEKPLAPMSWAQRHKRVFAIDVETCPDCGGKLRVIASTRDGFVVALLALRANRPTTLACAEEPALIAKILGHVRARDALGGVEARAPPVDQEEGFKLN